MRHAIRALDPLVVGKIAAGEVVERPAFAIKELVENSIDAGATAVTVEIREGGLSYFRVADNGCGIVPEDIRMAFARHATSKLTSADELSAIHTLGFRGEALASIAAVARVEMITRATGAETGMKAVVAGGVMETIEPAASPEGTSITVRDLFYNTPARRKFLKKPATEAGHVSDLVLRMILARPDISFRLLHEGRSIYHSPGNGSIRDALFSTLGRDVLANLVEVRGSAAGCAIHGFVGVGEAARSSRAMQTFILNGRYVRNAFLSQALDEGCRERVMIGKHAICAIHLTMAFESVDVNVHPNKLEVRFADERALMQGISEIVRAAFVVEPMQAAPSMAIEPTPGPAQDGDALRAFSSAAVAQVLSQEEKPAMRMRDSGGVPPITSNRPPVIFTEHSTAKTDRLSDNQDTASHVVHSQRKDVEPEQAVLPLDMPEAQQISRLLGVAWREYVFVQRGETLYIIDQHAAHERILYERFMKSMGTDVVSQQLLLPQTVQLTHREHAALTTSLTDLTAIGFDLEDYGDRSVQVRAVPVILGAPQMKDFFGELADRISEYRALPTQELKRDILVKFACRKAVKAGDYLDEKSIAHLIDEMQKTGAPPTCPHGRPLVIAIAKAELDKRFRRIP